VAAIDKALIEIEGALTGGTVVTDPDILEQYSHDESEVAPCMPAAAVRATSTAEVSAVLRVSSARGIPVTPRAAGTGRVGGAVPVEGGIVLTLERMGAIKGIEPEEMLAVVEPGVVTGDLHAAAEAAGLFYPPDPNSWATCAIGGNIAANAGGPRAFKYGVTREYVLGMEVVTGDGTVLRLGRRTRKGVTGYDLTALMVGSEGTLGVVTEAILRLVPLPEHTVTLLVMLPSEEAIERAVTSSIAHRLAPRCIELMDAETLEIIRPETALPIPPGARAMLLLELDGDAGGIDAQLETCGNAMDDAGALEVIVAKNGSERERLWASRRDLSHSLRGVAPHRMSEDVVVPRTRLAELLERTRDIAGRTGVRMPSYGHAGDGNLHINFLWNGDSDWERVERGVEGLLREVVALGGTIAGEHGVGAKKAPYLHLEQSSELIALQRRIKAIFDPKGILNPGKIFTGDRRFHGPC